MKFIFLIFLTSLFTFTAISKSISQSVPPTKKEIKMVFRGLLKKCENSHQSQIEFFIRPYCYDNRWFSINTDSAYFKKDTIVFFNNYKPNIVDTLSSDTKGELIQWRIYRFHMIGINQEWPSTGASGPTLSHTKLYIQNRRKPKLKIKYHRQIIDEFSILSLDKVLLNGEITFVLKIQRINKS